MVNIDESRTAVKYTPGRQGRKITAIAIHHWGAMGQSHDWVVDWFCNPAKGAQTSAHFVVSGGRVHCIVSPSDTAWHAGDWEANLTTIGIECRPEATEADYKTVAELVRWLRSKYGNLPLKPHKAFTSTACPGRWDLNRLDREARGSAGGRGNTMSGAMRVVPEMYGITQTFYANATIYNYGAGHGAIDYGTPQGTPVVAPEDGVVEHADWVWNLPDGWEARDYQIKPARGDTRTGGGIAVRLRNSIGSRWWHCHLSRTDLNTGDRVRKGQIIGYTGNTGSSTGPHLHLSLLPPQANWSNGYFGAIDPAPFIKMKYAPITSAAWQGSATSGKGSASSKFDLLEWLAMASQAEINKALTAWANSAGGKAAIGTAVLDRKFKDSQDRNISLAYVLQYDKSNWDLVRAIANAVRPSNFVAAILGHKKASQNGNKDVYQLITDLHKSITKGS